MSVSDLVFGNPWHGKLRPGQIELQPDTPLSSITFDGVSLPVQAVSGTLGVTRYHKAPGLTAPPVNAALSAAHGGLKDDFILYSSQLRYSPLSAVSPLTNELEWLLYDGTAQRWRRMSFGVTVNNLISTNFNAPSPEGTPVINVYVWRRHIVGDIDRVQGETGPATPSPTMIGSQNLPLIHAYSPIHRPTAYAYKPDNVLWSIDPSPDGRKLLVRLEARRWDGFELSAWNGNVPFQVYDATQSWLFGVWEITFNADGTIMSTAVPVWPDVAAPPPIPVSPNPAQPPRLDYIDYKLTVVGSPTWQVVPSQEFPDYNAVIYQIPVSIHNTGVNPYIQFDTSIMLNAAYDKDGNINLVHFRMYSENTYDVVSNFDAYLGTVYVLKTDDPANHIPEHNFNTQTIHFSSWASGTGANVVFTLYPQIKQMWNTVQTGGFNYIQKIDIQKGASTLKSWTGSWSGPMKWRWKTNNVVEIYVGSESKLRIGPGVVDDTPVSLTGYATYNPRTGQILSSETPIGWV